ncbi:hypothetical protein [Nocardia sp. NPDC050710]|uniref:hypothetical protein n=1 Tax=Nocardia sp. NPDC050710 TaxID=3157220 RepID=UPI0033F3E91C
MVGNRLAQFVRDIAEGLRSRQIPRLASHLNKTYRGPIGGDGLQAVGRGAGDADASAAEQLKHAMEGGQAGHGGAEQPDPGSRPVGSSVIPPAPLLSPRDVENALTNLAMSSADRLRAFGPGSGFSGVYHPGTGKMLAYPSGDTRTLDFPGEPANLVSRYGGHVDVEDKLLRAINRSRGESVGFSAVLREDGSLGCRWTSRSVNLENHDFDGPYVPEHLRPEIMRVMQEITARRVESDI